MILYEPMFLDGQEFWMCRQLENFSYPAHMHRYLEWVYVQQGRVEVQCRDISCRLCAGDALMVPPNTPHSFTEDGPARWMYIAFSPELVPAFQRQMQNKCPVSYGYRPQPLLAELAQLLLPKQTDKPLLWVKGLLYMLCANFAEQVSWKEHPQNDLLLEQVVQFVQEHFSEDITLGMLAQKLGYQYHYLSRRLKQELNMNFSGFLTQHRIAYACFLLRERDFTVTEIARLSGYNSLRGFHKAFRQVTGMSPRAYCSGQLQQEKQGH